MRSAIFAAIYFLVTLSTVPSHAMTCTAPGVPSCTISCFGECAAVYNKANGTCKAQCVNFGESLSEKLIALTKGKKGLKVTKAISVHGFIGPIFPAPIPIPNPVCPGVCPPVAGPGGGDPSPLPVGDADYCYRCGNHGAHKDTTAKGEGAFLLQYLIMCGGDLQFHSGKCTQAELNKADWEN